jgi:hypothetical protein
MSLAGALLAGTVNAQSAEGFGALTLGAYGCPDDPGTPTVDESIPAVYTVTRLDDEVISGTPTTGTFRWAVLKKGPRIVNFAVSGDITLTQRLEIKTTTSSNRNYLTVDGSTAPDKGVCIRGAEILLRDTVDTIFRHVRIRRGRTGVGPFPASPVGSSVNLDCLTMDNAKYVLFDHVSFSWSCDELVGITRSQNVTFQWCIFAEPLGDVALSIHPYGTDHSAGMNVSSSTVSVHHSLFYNFRFRGPNFEANDVRNSTPSGERSVKLESVNNIIFNYSESGGRYSSEIENKSSPDDTPTDATFYFQFVGNRYFNGDASRPEIAVNTGSGPDTSGRLKVYVSGNIGPNRPTDLLPETDLMFTGSGSSKKAITHIDNVVYLNQVSASPLFTHPSGEAITVYPADDDLVDLVLAAAGARPATRDDADARVVSQVMARDTSDPRVADPDDVGGWPVLGDEPPSPWTDMDIGSVGLAGGATLSGGTHTITGSGDLKGPEDRFHFVYQEATDDCEIIARVASISDVDEDAAAGVMIRDNLDDNCRMAAMLLTAENSAKARRRTSVSGNTIDTTVAVSAPEWVKLNRTGNTFKYYRCGDGVSWTLEKTVTISMGNTTYIGLAVTSDDNSKLATGVFTDVTVTQ